MKKFICLMICIILSCNIVTGCNTKENKKSELKYGTYKIEKVKHLPIFSSSGLEYYLKQNSRVLFTVKDGSFATNITKAKEPSVLKVNYENVRYIEESLDNVILTMGKNAGDLGKIDLSTYNKKVSYKVITNSKDTGELFSINWTPLS